MSNKDGLARLRQLKASGKKNNDLDEEEDVPIYDVVDSEGFRKLQRDRLYESEFVVDDDGSGYLDRGQGDFDEEGYYVSENDEEERRKQEKAKNKRKKGEKADGSLTKMFGKAAAAAPAASKSKYKSSAKPQTTDHLDNLLADIEAVAPPRKRKPEQLNGKKTKRGREESKIAGWTKGVEGTKDYSLHTEARSKPLPVPLATNGDDSDPFMDEDGDSANMDIDMSFVRGSEEDYRPISVPEIQETKTMVEAAVGSPVGELDDSSLATALSPTQSQPKASQEEGESKWFDIGEKLQESFDRTSIAISNIGAEHIEMADPNDDAFFMFWTDYEEVNGTLLLYGKVKLKDDGQYVSCCLQVSNILKPLYLLPRPECTMKQVHEEIESLLAKRNIKGCKSKPSIRKYCFDMTDVPRNETQYYKLMIPFENSFSKNNLDNLQSGNTFSHVFGHSAQLFEQFVIALDVMGPCWLKVRNGSFNNVASTWCRVAVKVDEIFNLEVVAEPDAPCPAPPMNIMSLSTRTMMNKEGVKQELVGVSFRVYQNVQHDTTERADKMRSSVFTGIRPIDAVWPMGFENEVERHNKKTPSNHIALFKNEQSLLNFCIGQIERYDPDIILGHELENIHLNVILHRLKEHKIKTWHKIGRMKRQGYIDLVNTRRMFSGRLLCDLNNPMGRSMTTKCDSWSLTEMCRLYLDQTVRLDIDGDAGKCEWTKSSQGLFRYIGHNEMDTGYVAAIAFRIQILALSKQLTNLSGNSWARTLSGSRVDRNNFLLLHEFARQKYIIPDKKRKGENGQEEGSGKNKFQGGLVLEPEKGLYKNLVLVMDFNSLYPSVIQEHNICFTTINLAAPLSEGSQLPEYPDDSQDMGLFPRIIETLVKRRREVKRNMKDPKATAEQMSQWDIKQQALKLTANSMYGCLGFPGSKFYARPLAEMTTFKGREALVSTKGLAESTGLQVVYGDTDSVMINTNTTDYEKALAIGNDFKKKVNERYRKLEIDIDNVFGSLLLTAKKKYAATVISRDPQNGVLVNKLEVKGLDLRRREFCQLSKEASEYALDQVLNQENIDEAVSNIHQYLRKLNTDMRDNQCPLPKYIIRKKLGKDPRQYPEGKQLPHVAVALRQLEQGQTVRADDVMQYIVCENGSSEDDKGNDKENAESKKDGDEKNLAKIGQDTSAEPLHVAQRCFSISEVRHRGLRPDAEWYLAVQIFPPLERVCEHVEGADRMQLADCLGLDGTKYKTVQRAAAAERAMGIKPLDSSLTDEERFSECRRLSFTCLECGHDFSFDGIMGVMGDSRVHADGIHCSACDKIMSQTVVNAQLEIAIRREISQYYAGWLICKDPSCGVQTRQVSVYGKKCVNTERNCISTMRYLYTDRQLYSQLLYFDSLFNVDKLRTSLEAKKTSDPNKKEDADSRIKIEKLKALASQNAARFAVTRQVIDKYLSTCGYRYVSMRDIFSS